jgi:hypothetical protein
MNAVKFWKKDLLIPYLVMNYRVRRIVLKVEPGACNEGWRIGFQMEDSHFVAKISPLLHLSFSQ